MSARCEKRVVVDNPREGRAKRFRHFTQSSASPDNKGHVAGKSGRTTCSRRRRTERKSPHGLENSSQKRRGNERMLEVTPFGFIFLQIQLARDNGGIFKISPRRHIRAFYSAENLRGVGAPCDSGDTERESGKERSE